MLDNDCIYNILVSLGNEDLVSSYKAVNEFRSTCMYFNETNKSLPIQVLNILVNDSTDKEILNLLTYSIKENDLGLFKWLFSNEKIKVEDEHITEIIDNNRLNMVKELVKSNVYINPNYIDQTIILDHFHIFKYLVNKGYEYTSRALTLAVVYNRLDAIELLLDRGESDIDWSTRCGNLETIKFLKDKGIDLTEEIVESAARFNKLDVVKYLVEMGIDCTTRAVDYAATFGHINVVKYLIEQGKDCSVEAVNGASMFGHFNIVMYLVEHGKKCTQKTLQLAIVFDHFELIKYLVEEVGIKCSQNIMFSAIQCGNRDIVEYIHDKHC